VTRAILNAFRILGLALAIAVQISWLGQPAPVLLKVLPLAELALSVGWPGPGLVALAGIGAFAGPITALAGSPLPGSRLLEQLVLATIVGSAWHGRRERAALRLTEPALLVAVTAAASAMAVQPALMVREAPGLTIWEHLRLLAAGGYFERSPLSNPLFFAVLILEGMALAVTAESLTRRDARLAPRVVGMMAVGCAGLALLSLLKLIGAALRTDTVLASFARVFAQVRVSELPDLNAAGSVFAMVGLASFGVLVTHRRSWWVASSLALVALGLWMAGSRSAMMAVAVVLAVLIVLEAVRRRGRGRVVASVGLASLVAVCLCGLMLYPSARNVGFGPALATREVLARAGLNMWRSAPVFGVGVGRFYDESSQFGADALNPYGGNSGNAHDNFLQVLAEEGLVGLGALLVLLGVVLLPAVQAERSSSRPFRRFVLAGIAAYVLTWFTGHPQLVPEAAFLFWLLFGVAAALTSPPRSSPWRLGAVVAAAALILVAPIRADWTIRQANFEYLGEGLSPYWEPELDGVRYREAGGHFALYLPADGTAVVLPLRRESNAPDPLVFSLHVGATSLGEVRLSGEGWRNVPLDLPRLNRRFALVDFEAVGQLPAGDVVLVGKPERR
jgi:O-antigen ligase